MNISQRETLGILMAVLCEYFVGTVSSVLESFDDAEVKRLVLSPSNEPLCAAFFRNNIRLKSPPFKVGQRTLRLS